MCDCKTSIEAQLSERFKTAQPAASNHKVSLNGYGFAITKNTMIMLPFMAYTETADYPVKGRTFSRSKSTKGNMFFSFCPFCGVEIKPEEGVN